MDTLTPVILASEAKLADYRAEIRQHEQRISSIRRVMKIVEARLARLRLKTKEASDTQDL